MNGCRVFWHDLGDASAALPEDAALSAAEERAISRWTGKRLDQARGARRLLRAALQRLHGVGAEAIALEDDAEGVLRNARVADARLPVSLSHSGPIVACIVAAAGPVGVDVERVDQRRAFREMAAVAFGPAERELVEREGVETFYRIWTLREAVAKATGRGFEALVDGRDLTASTEWTSHSFRVGRGYWISGVCQAPVAPAIELVRY